MKNFKILLFILFLYNCSSTEKVGNSKYRTSIKRVNSGDFEALIYKYKQYICNKDTVFGVLIRAQKLDFETKKDSVFGYGKLEIKKEDNKTFIITKEININGYDNFTEIDSIIRFYEQLKDGKVKFKEIKYYRNGIEKSNLNH